MVAATSAAMQLLSLDGLWEATYNYTAFPVDHPFGEYASVPLQVFLVVRHGRLRGLDVTGCDWSGRVSWKTHNTVLAEIAIDPTVVSDVWVIGEDDKPTSQPVRFLMDLEVVIHDPVLTLMSVRTIGSYRVEGVVKLTRRFDGADF